MKIPRFLWDSWNRPIEMSALRYIYPNELDLVFRDLSLERTMYPLPPVERLGNFFI